MKSIEEKEYQENLPAELEEDFGMPLFELALRGQQKINNSMAASISDQVMGIRNATIRDSLTSFDSVSHRLEYVAAVRGVMYINDSKATNINAVWFSLENMESPVVLILEGDHEDIDYSVIKEMVNEKVKAIVCLGENNKGIHRALAGDVQVMVDAPSLEEAVKMTYMLASKGDVVLFSPACSSFGRFKNYEDRGTQFAENVRKL